MERGLHRCASVLKNLVSSVESDSRSRVLALFQQRQGVPSHSCPRSSCVRHMFFLHDASTCARIESWKVAKRRKDTGDDRIPPSFSADTVTLHSMLDAKWHEPAQDHHLDMFLLFVCLTHISHGTAHFILSGARPAQVFREILLRDASALPYRKRANAQAHYFELCVQELTGRVIIVIVMMRAFRKTVNGTNCSKPVPSLQPRPHIERRKLGIRTPPSSLLGTMHNANEGNPATLSSPNTSLPHFLA